MNPSRIRYQYCLECKREYALPVCRLSRLALCSSSCRSIWHEKKKTEALRHRLRHCVICGIPFFPRAMQIQQGVGRFCSQSCRNKGLIGAKQHPDTIAKRLAAWRANGHKKILGGPLNGHYRGGSVSSHGYRLHSNGHGVQRAEHRSVMDNLAGRQLGHDELVHHQNGNKLDNRPDNLMIVSRAQHALLHAGKRNNKTGRFEK